MQDYVHGYSGRERERLADQAETLAELLHADTSYPSGSVVLEVGCGVGAQTVTLARRSPGATIVAMDISEDSLAAARARVRSDGFKNVTFQQADVYAMAFAPAAFDHVFACFVLEHLARPREALAHLRQVLKPGGTITVIEGDHGSTYFHPESPYARHAIRCLIELQARAGGDSLIGRTPRMVYVDGSRPQLVEGFTKNTFTAMVEGVRERALAAIPSSRRWRDDEAVARRSGLRHHGRGRQPRPGRALPRSQPAPDHGAVLDPAHHHPERTIRAAGRTERASQLATGRPGARAGKRPRRQAYLGL